MTAESTVFPQEMTICSILDAHRQLLSWVEAAARADVSVVTDAGIGNVLSLVQGEAA